MSSPKKFSSNQLDNFKNVAFTKFLSNKCEILVWKLRKFTLTHFWQKNFVKVMVLLKKVLNSWFDEIFLVRVNFSFFHTISTLIKHILEFFLDQFAVCERVKFMFSLFWYIHSTYQRTPWLTIVVFQDKVYWSKLLYKFRFPSVLWSQCTSWQVLQWQWLKYFHIL